MKKQILFVDDNVDTLESVKELMEMHEYDVDTVQSGKECIEKAKQKKYDLILIDILMPGMSGYEVFEGLRKTINHLTPLVYITIKPKEEVKLADIEGFIQKPFENQELINAVKDIINNFKPPKEAK